MCGSSFPLWWVIKSTTLLRVVVEISPKGSSSGVLSPPMDVFTKSLILAKALTISKLLPSLDTNLIVPVQSSSSKPVSSEEEEEDEEDDEEEEEEEDEVVATPFTLPVFDSGLSPSSA